MHLQQKHAMMHDRSGKNSLISKGCSQHQLLEMKSRKLTVCDLRCTILEKSMLKIKATLKTPEPQVIQRIRAWSISKNCLVLIKKKEESKRNFD